MTRWGLNGEIPAPRDKGPAPPRAHDSDTTRIETAGAGFWVDDAVVARDPGTTRTETWPAGGENKGNGGALSGAADADVVAVAGRKLRLDRANASRRCPGPASRVIRVASPPCPCSQTVV